jgi:hypothetical protein
MSNYRSFLSAALFSLFAHISAACIEIGCFYIAGNGVVDTQSMINAREEARKLFSLSEHVYFFSLFSCHLSIY